MKIIALTKYGSLGASSRMRFEQYIQRFNPAELDVFVEPLINDSILQRRYDSGRYGVVALIRAYAKRVIAMLTISKYDLVWIEKEALPWFPLWLENFLLMNCKYVLDFDDATFHDYDQHRFKIVRLVFGNRIDGLMKRSALVVAGNSYLADRALNSGAKDVHVIPTVVDIDRYKALDRKIEASRDKLPCIVWIGSPSTVKYIYLIKNALTNLAKKHDFVLKVIGGGPLEITGVNISHVDWSHDTEINNLLTSDIGIMPLDDSYWERGKCGYKIIQYMACGLPTVASAVGANVEILNSHSVGFLVSSQQEWEVALDRLLTDQKLRASIGKQARERVEESYCIQETEHDMKKLLLNIPTGII